MLTKQQIIERLMEIHQEVSPDTIDESAFALAWQAGHADPCGCDICQLIDDLNAEVVDEARG